MIIVVILGATWIAYKNAKRIQQIGNKATCENCAATWYYSTRDVEKNGKRMSLMRSIVIIGEMMIHHSHLFSILEKEHGLSRCPRCGSSDIRVEESSSNRNRDQL